MTYLGKRFTLFLNNCLVHRILLQVYHNQAGIFSLQQVATCLVSLIIFFSYFFPVVLSLDEVTNHNRYRIETSQVDEEIMYIGPDGQECISANLQLSFETARKECTEFVYEQSNLDANYIMQLYVTVYDKYGRHLNGTLATYSANNSTIYDNLQLINGLPYNGTYLGTIHELKNSSIVRYAVSFMDEFGYQSDTIQSIDRLITLNPSTPPVVNSLQMLTPAAPMEPVKFRAIVTDSEDDVKNVTLHYIKSANDVNEIPMKWAFADTYEAIIPGQPENATIMYFADAYDNYGNSGSNGIGFMTFKGYTVKTPWWINQPELLDNVKIKSKVMNMNLDNRTADMTLLLGINNANRTQISDTLISNENTTYAVIEGVNSDPDLSGNKIFNFTLPLKLEQQSETEWNDFSNKENVSIADYSNIDRPYETFVKLSGDPTKYPFDKYFIRLIIAVPLENANFRSSNSLSDLVNVNWDDRYSAMMLPSNTNSVHNLLKCPQHGDPNNDRASSMLCDNSTTTVSYNLDSPSFLDMRIELARGYTISVVIIPLISIFYLLGAIFIFDNSQDSIGNILALTLSIFALIFTLPDIINSMKPQTSAPTIADSMLSIIIIATIAFTVSSILSSSSIMLKWFPKHHSWIDVSVFAIISLFVVSYFNNYLFDNEMWWLVPLIIFGLGYGLLLRVFGIKIDKPLINILWWRSHFHAASSAK
jgi:hypothetical protein